MQLVLKQDVETLGKMGDIVTVKDGYGRNYLMPQGLADTVTEENIRRVEKTRVRQEEEKNRELETVRSLAEQLDSASCTVVAKANEEGHLFGSVGPQQIVGALTADGFKVTQKMVELEPPIKDLGVYDVTIRLHPEVAATCKVWVVAE